MDRDELATARTRHLQPITYEAVDTQCTPISDRTSDSDVTNRHSRSSQYSSNDSLSSDDTVVPRNFRDDSNDEDDNVSTVTLVGATIMSSAVLGAAAGAVAYTAVESDNPVASSSNSDKEEDLEKTDDLYTPN